MIKLKFFFVFTFSLLFLTPSTAKANDPETLLRNMKPSWKRVSDFTLEMDQYELIGTKVVTKSIFVKFAKPFRVYIKYLKGPGSGRQVIYQGRGWNKGKVLVSLGSFPNLTLSIHPFARKAIENKHHPITNIGFDFLIRLALGQIKIAKENNELALKNAGSDIVDGKRCTLIEMQLNAKRGKEVSSEQGDSWMKLAKRHGANYAVVAHNNQGKKPHKASQAIWVPTYYGSKLSTCIDDATGLPIQVKVWDHAGKLYENYTFRNLKVNVGLSDIDFDRKNADYNF